MRLYSRWIHRIERRLTLADTNRRIFPFEWGLDWIPHPENGAEPRDALLLHAREALRSSSEFFDPGPLGDWKVDGEEVEFPSPFLDRYEFNNTVYCRLFPAKDLKRAVVVIPQWNADSESHVALCRMLQKLGVAALRICLPYHEKRLPPGMKRADYMVSPNLGRTLTSTRKAVQEVRHAVQLLYQLGYERVGVMGTSVGSCVGYLAFVHDPEIRAGVFNHVSAFFADVVWTGLSTRYVKWGLEGRVELEDLREIWGPVSPYHFVERLRGVPRPHLLITANYDLTFLPELTDQVFERYESLGIPYDRARLPCGHYTTAHFPFSWLDGWHICRYLLKHL